MIPAFFIHKKFPTYFYVVLHAYVKPKKSQKLSLLTLLCFGFLNFQVVGA
jgi:hypothetical protein